jgi:hypothetical protein
MNGTRMNLLLFIENDQKTRAKRFGKTVTDAITDQCVETIHCFSDLENRLVQVPRTISLLVVWVTNLEMLHQLKHYETCLEGINTILILPDRQSETWQAGLGLKPRYITTRDNDFSHINAVIHRIGDKIESYNRLCNNNKEEKHHV